MNRRTTWRRGRGGGGGGGGGPGGLNTGEGSVSGGDNASQLVVTCS